MAVQLTKIGNSPNTRTKEFVCDTQAEKKNLPKAPMGSSCLCLKDGSVWIKGGDINEGTSGWIQL